MPEYAPGFSNFRLAPARSGAAATRPAASVYGEGPWLQSDFNTIIDKINSNGMDCLPIGDALRYYG